MAGSRTKHLDEEKYVKMLREMASLPHNRQCFDCGQRGPTYINATIGSFVCMTCSGLLRGLNPPHRVKSISVASFSADEIEFVRSRGNEFCRKVWQNSRPPTQFDTKDEHRIRDSMSERYEKKRWYLPPQEFMYEEARKQNAASDTKDTANRPLSSLIGNGRPLQSGHDGQTLHSYQPASIQRPSGVAGAHLASGAQLTGSLASPRSPTLTSPTDQAASTKTSSADLLADFGGDPFANTSFPAFTAFNSNPQVQGPLPNAFPSVNRNQGGAVDPSVQNAPSAAAADRYTALAELDGVFSNAATATKVNWDVSPTSTTSHPPRGGTTWVASPPSLALPQCSPYGLSSGGGGGGGGYAGSNPFGVSSAIQSPVYNPFVGNLVMAPGYGQAVSPTFGQFSPQPGMAYGQFCAVPVTAGIRYGFPNGMGGGWPGKTPVPASGMPQPGAGWGQPTMGGNPFMNTSASNALNPFM